MIVTATPNFGYIFDTWTGCDAPSGNSCTMTMDTNKTVTANFRVLPQLPDLVVENVSILTPVLLRNEKTTVKAVIRNRGSAKAKKFSVSLFKNLVAPPSAASRGDAQKTVSSLEAGASADIEFTISYKQDGLYKLWVLADSRNEIKESIEDNNYGPLNGVSINVGFMWGFGITHPESLIPDCETGSTDNFSKI